MNLLRRWAGWAVFWGALCYFGQIQAWVSDGFTNPPALLGVVASLDFWHPYVLFVTPVSAILQSAGVAPVWLSIAATLAWVVVFSWLLVFGMQSLHPRAASRITWGVIGGVTGVLVVFRLFAYSDPEHVDVLGLDILSRFLLSSVVIAAWLYLAIGLAVMRARRRRSGS